MSFVVNGQTAQWSNDAVKDDTVYAVNRNFPNLPLGPNGMISIQVSGSWIAEWPSFQKKWEELTKAGLRLVALDTYKSQETRVYTGVFRAGSDAHALWVGPTGKTS